VTELSDDGDGDVLRYRKAPVEAEPVATQAGAQPTTQQAPVAWLMRDAAPEAPAERNVTPSTAIDEEAARGVTPGDKPHALLRGVLVHRLLQSLPELAPERRAAAADQYLARAGHALADAERANLSRQVLRVIEDARFAALFASPSRAEVPIVGRLMRDGVALRVSGQVDRLAVTPDAVLIGDFKTNRAAPRRIEDVPPAYVGQLALYRAVLMLLYPDRPVRAALIWTEVPDLMEFSAEVLDGALAQFTTA
jgi:ATP-dependent helicase/nuclease subunit A